MPYEEMTKEDLIATIRDRNKRLETVCEQLDTIMEDNGNIRTQNTVLQEAFERIDYLSKYYAAKLSCHMDKDTNEPLNLDPIAQEFADIVREALAKVSQKEIFSDEPNRNAQTE